MPRRWGGCSGGKLYFCRMMKLFPHFSGRRVLLRQALTFGLIGVGATGLHYGIYALFLGILRPAWAYTVGYGVSLVANFLLNAALTFRSRATARRGLGFLGAHAVNYLIHIMLLNFFLWAGVPERWAPLPVFAVAVPVNFVLVRRVFSGSGSR